MSLMTMFETGNYIEAGLWGVVGLGFLIHAVLRRRTARTTSIAAATFLLFGLSDVIEVETGAWWRPWWLFCWKASCVISMLLLFIQYKRSKSRPE